MVCEDHAFPTDSCLGVIRVVDPDVITLAVLFLKITKMVHFPNQLMERSIDTLLLA